MNHLWVLLAAAVLLSACNTLEGVGRDLRAAGQKIEESSKKK